MTAPRLADAASADRHSEGAPTDHADPPVPRRHPRLALDRDRSLLLLGLLGAAVVVLWLRLLATAPHLPLDWQAAAAGGIRLAATSDLALKPSVGRQLQSLVLADGQHIAASPALLPRSPRWIVDDDQRRQHQAVQALVAQAVLQPQVSLQFEQGSPLALAPRPRGLGGLGALCWALSALALLLYLAAVVVVLARPRPASLLYAGLAMSMGLGLLLIAAESLPGMGLPSLLAPGGPAPRLLADAIAAAALWHVLLLYPRRAPHAAAWAALAWSLAGAGLAWLLLAQPAGSWWWMQGLVIGSGLAAALALRQRRGQAIHPLSRVLQRLVLAGTGTLLLLSLAIASTGSDSGMQNPLTRIGSLAWVVFFASLLLLGPFLVRSRQVFREFMLLAGMATVATSLNLLFIGISTLDPLISMVLALAVSLTVYALARPWIQGQLSGSGQLSAERMFDSLYRAARALEQSPGQASKQLTALLAEVFDPLESTRSQRLVTRVRLAPDGASMVVPIPRLPDSEPGAIVLRHARRGRRLFTESDRELCEQLLEQLSRAVAYDRAVEHGRTEERARIAQDLHDDIGARLLTLMYKAQNAEIEEYIRHTLQDLKTLTRGLAKSSHPLSHAAAEWKADIAQRLSAAGCDLQWSFSTDADFKLSVVQWSALTRVLRELVNNILTHAQATQVEIVMQVDTGRLSLDVSDDGRGNTPEAWSHGLGLGGVRKRVKLLGGQVQWLEREGRGIRCEVRADLQPDDAASEPG